MRNYFWSSFLYKFYNGLLTKVDTFQIIRCFLGATGSSVFQDKLYL